jgi:hypothetical protein
VELTTDEWLKIKGWLLELRRFQLNMGEKSQEIQVQNYMREKANEIKDFLDSKIK